MKINSLCDGVKYLSTRFHAIPPFYSVSRRRLSQNHALLRSRSPSGWQHKPACAYSANLYPGLVDCIESSYILRLQRSLRETKSNHPGGPHGRSVVPDSCNPCDLCSKKRKHPAGSHRHRHRQRHRSANGCLGQQERSDLRIAFPFGQRPKGSV